jgi:hypothetical protein
MSLEKLKQEAEALQSIDATQLSPEQLSALVEQLSSLLERSEESLINTTLIDINTTPTNDESK